MNTDAGVVPLTDERLAKVVSSQHASGQDTLVVANGFTALIASKAGGNWSEVGRGDFGTKCGAAAKLLARSRKLSWIEVVGSPSACDLATASGVEATEASIDAWIAEAEALTGTSGRGASPNAGHKEYLVYEAGWRCQFSGCGRDLGRESLSGTPGNFAYFAHIIASSPKGPRGDPLLSGRLAQDITNIILLCDECHRRIDREDPERFTVEVLREMRAESVREVRRLLDSLRYEEAVPIVVMGNVTAQSPRFVQKDAEEAMWTRGLRMASRGPEHFFNAGGHQHDPHDPHYWGSLFVALRSDVPLLRKHLNGTRRADGTTIPLAVFPLHSTSVLVLAGRIVGEGSRVTIFQFNRDRQASAPGGQWAFDKDSPTPATGKYTVSELATHSGSQAACLIVSLTYKIDPARLPPELYADGRFKVGAMEVTAMDPGMLRHSVFAHPSDIDAFAVALENAVRTLQDEWRVKDVHLFVGAPASACFRIGQKLQARHHARVICYESLPGPDGSFMPTIAISNKEVRELQSGGSIPLE